tara:strand:+ start:145 stop:1977 length:1833 start_codon:yes stop_codon:yes gene_type:complete
MIGKFKLFFLFIFIFSGHLLCQTLDVICNKNTFEVGEDIIIKYTVNKKAENFTSPNFGGLVILSGPNPSTSQSVSIINGVTSIKSSTTYSFYLRANKTGEYKISAASIIVDNKKIKSKELNLSIVKATNNQIQQKKVQVKNQKNIFIEGFISNPNPYLGEPITLKYILYNRLRDLSSLSINKMPVFSNFWKKDIPQSNNSKTEIINNKYYEVSTVLEYILIPQNKGSYKIDPIEILAAGFFSGNQIIKSNSILIDVKDIKNAPLNFSGVVGDFKIETKLEKDSVLNNEVVSYFVTIIGKGNIELVTWDDIQTDFPKDFEIIKSNIDESKIFKAGIHRSKKTFEYILIPKFEGKYDKIKTSITAFNFKDKKFYTITSPTNSLKVLNNPNAKNEKTDDLNKYSTDKDINFIKKNPKNKKNNKLYKKYKKLNQNRKDNNWIYLEEDQKIKNNHNLYENYLEEIKKEKKSTIYIILFFVPFFVLIILKFYNTYVKNSRLNKNVKSSKIAQKRLKIAQKLLKKQDFDGFFEEIEKSLWNYFAFKFNINAADLSKETIEEYFINYGLSIDIKDNFISLLNECELVRYSALKNDEDKIGSIIHNAKDIITEIEKNIK